MANRVIAEILRQGRNQPRRYVLAALATGKVESNFRNLSYGDADSQGWRQERASLYRNPTNLRASVRRFYQEAAQHDRGQGAGRLAADVQRPAAKYRGRYAQVLPQAKQILSGRGAITGGGGASGGRLSFAPGQAVNVAELLSTLGDQASQPQPAVTPPAAPAFSTGPATPQGYRPIESTAPQQRPDYLGALEKLHQLQSTAGLSQALRSGGSAGSKESGAGLNLSPHGGWAGTKGPVKALARLSGLKVSSEKRDTMSTATGGVSDHWVGSKSSFADDLSGSQAQMDRAAVKLARQLGIKGYKRGSPLVKTINRNGIRYQLLYRTNVGGNHFDHIHVGARRL